MKINWDLIGPVLGSLIVILTIIFTFILRMRKMDRTPHNPPKNSGYLDKKTLCFEHERDISSNSTAVKMIDEQLNRQEEQNTIAHNRIYDKMQESEDKILEAIKNNG